MNKKGMTLFSAMDGASDDMLIDALPPGMGAYKEKNKSHRLSGFFDRPWVAAVVSAAVALVVLTGIIWAGQKAAKDPSGLPGEIAGNPAGSDLNALESDKRPDYNNPPVPEDAKMVISSGGYTIAPAEYIQWKQTWNDGTKEFEEERGAMQWGELMPELDSGGDDSPLMAEISKLPRIPYADDFTFSVSDRPLELQYASAYKEYQQSYKHTYSIALDTGLHTVADLMTELSEGSYYILVVAYERGADIEGTDQWEGTMYEFVFRIDVFGETVTQPHDDAYTEDFEPVDVKVCLHSSQKTVGLKPYVVAALQYNEILSEWAEVDGDGLDGALQQYAAELPALVYDDEFHVYIKEIDGTATPRYLYIYDEHFNEVGKYRMLSGKSFPWFIEELATLSKGSYYVILGFYQTGITIGTETESGSYEYGFNLIVDPDAVKPPKPSETDPFLDLGVKVLAGHDYSPFLELSPHVEYAGFYDDASGEWLYERGEDLGTLLPECANGLPVITYNNTFRMYTENLRASENEREYQLEFVEYVVYRNNYEQALVCHDVTEDLYMLSELQPGAYYVVVDANLIRRILDVGWEKGEYQFTFKLVVPDLNEDTPPFTSGDLMLESSSGMIDPARRNEWTENLLDKNLNDLPVLFLASDEECRVFYHDDDLYGVARLTVYKAENGILGSRVMQVSATDLSALSSLQDGIYCVSFVVECAGEDDLEVMFCEYAFLLYAGYEAATGVADE